MSEEAKDQKHDEAPSAPSASGEVPESELEALADSDDVSGGTDPVTTAVASAVTAAASAAYASMQSVCPTGVCTGDCAGRG